MACSTSPHLVNILEGFCMCVYMYIFKDTQRVGGACVSSHLLQRLIVRLMLKLGTRSSPSVVGIQLSCHYYSLKGSMLAANQTRSQSLGSIPGTQLWDMSIFICRLNIHPENISNPHITCFSNTHFSMNFLETPHSILVKAT